MAFSLHEKYDMENAKRINYDLVPDDYKTRIMNTLKRTVKGSVKVNYKQTKPGVGRYYATVANKNGGYCCPLQMMPSIVRNALTSSIYHDIDIVNCHPILLEVVAAKLDSPVPTPSLSMYNSNREEILNQLSCDRLESKNLMQRLVYGGSIESWKKCSNYEGEIPNIFFGIAQEVQNITMNLLLENPEYISTAKKLKKSDCVKDSSVLSYFLGTIESEIVKVMMEYFQESNWTVGSYIYDGILVEKRENVYLSLDLCEKYVFEKTTFPIKLKEKPITVDPNILCSKSEYEKIKEEFELTHFKLKNPFEFVRILSNGDIQLLKPAELFSLYKNLEVFVGDSTVPFISLWEKDPKMRTYEKLDLIPPPLEVPEGVYNTWTGFPVEHFETGGEHEFFLEHLDKCYEPEVVVYLLKWLAWLVQKPGVLPGVCNVIRGKQGSGKSIIFETCLAKMLGSYYGTTNNPKNDLFGTFAELKNGKRLIVINDCPVSQIKNGAETFKALITDEQSRYEKKFHQSISMRNITGYMMITNSDEPVRLESSDRRYMVADCKPNLIGNFEYFKQLSEKIKDDKNVRAVYDYLMMYDISQVVNLARERPVTQAYLDNKMVSADKELLFLASIIPNISNMPYKSAQLYKEFKAWALEYGGVSDERFLRSNVSFGIYLKKVSGIVWKSDPSHGSKLYFEKEILAKYLSDQGIQVDGVCVIGFEEIDSY